MVLDMADKKKLDTKNDKAWQLLFETHDIVDDCHKNGFYEISRVRYYAKRNKREISITCY